MFAQDAGSNTAAIIIAVSTFVTASGAVIVSVLAAKRAGMAVDVGTSTQNKVVDMAKVVDVVHTNTNSLVEALMLKTEKLATMEEKERAAGEATAQKAISAGEERGRQSERERRDKEDKPK